MPQMSFGPHGGTRRRRSPGPGLGAVIASLVFLAIVGVGAGAVYLYLMQGSPKAMVTKMVAAELSGQAAEYAPFLTAQAAEQIKYYSTTPLGAVKAMPQLELTLTAIGEPRRDGAEVRVPATFKLSVEAGGRSLSQDLQLEYVLVKEQGRWKCDPTRTIYNGMPQEEILRFMRPQPGGPPSLP